MNLNISQSIALRICNLPTTSHSTQMFTRVTKQSSKQVNSFLPTRATPAANAGSAWPTNKEVIWVICHPNKKQSLRASRPPIHGHDVGNVREVRACWLVVLCRCTTANHPHGLHVLWRTKVLTLSGSGAAGIGCGANSVWSRTQRRQPSKHASWQWLRSTGQRIPLTRCPVQMRNSQSLLSASCPVTDWGAALSDSGTDVATCKHERPCVNLHNL